MTSTKTCLKCSKEKPFSDFNKGNGKYGLHVWCRDCYKVWAAEYYKKNKDKISESHREYHLKNHEAIKKNQRDYYYNRGGKEKAKEYRATHREQQRMREQEWRDRNREHYRRKQNEYYHKNKDKNKEWHKKWRDSHKEQIKESSKKYREENREKINQSHIERLHNDPIYKMKEQTRNMLRYALRSKGYHKSSRSADILGCDLDFFCKYLFKTWEKNYGKPWNGEPYHIDHIVPLAIAKTEKDVIRLCHYTNLQLLTPEDNMAKHDKI